MSTALARLRRHYRDDLLVRVGRDYELTPFARSLLPLVEQTVPMIEQALALRDEFDAATSDRTFSIILSDYAFAVISEPLLRQISRLAPHVRVEFGPIPWDMHLSDRGLLRYDILVGPLGCGFPGQSAVLFHDRFVCVTDPAHERLSGGGLSLEDFQDLPHAVANFGPNLTPLDRALSAKGIRQNPGVSSVGWLSLPFVVRHRPGGRAPGTAGAPGRRRGAGDDRGTAVRRRRHRGGRVVAPDEGGRSGPPLAVRPDAGPGRHRGRRRPGMPGIPSGDFRTGLTRP